MSKNTKQIYQFRNASASSVGSMHYPYYKALLSNQKVYRVDKLNKVEETLTKDHPGIQGNPANIIYYGYKDLRLTRPKKMKKKDKSKTTETIAINSPYYPFYKALLNRRKIYRVGVDNNLLNTIMLSSRVIKGNASNIVYYDYRFLSLDRPNSEKDSSGIVDNINSDGPTPSRYKWEWKGVTFDFYRLCEILGIKHHAQAHALKKIIRAGKSIKSVEQDIDETIAALLRWKEMLKEEEQ